MPYKDYTFQDALAERENLLGNQAQRRLIDYKLGLEQQNQGRAQALRDIYAQGQQPTVEQIGAYDPDQAMQYQNNQSLQKSRESEDALRKHNALKGISNQLLTTAERMGFRRDDPSTYGIINQLAPKFKPMYEQFAGIKAQDGPVDVEALIMMADSTPGEKMQQQIQGKLQEQQALLPGQLGLEQQKNQLEISKQGQLYGMQYERDKGIEQFKAGLATEKDKNKLNQQAQVSLPKIIDQTNQALSLLESIKNHKGLSSVVGVPGVTGGLLGGKIIPGTDSADFNAKLKQAQGQAFLQAFEALKGGGQITEIEGEKATQAIANLDTAQSEEQFKMAVTELEGILKQALKRASGAAQGRYNQDAYTGSWGDEQQQSNTPPPGSIVHESRSTGKIRYSTDGGKTFKVLE